MTSKAKKKEYNQQYWLKNREHLRKASKEWYYKNKERTRQYRIENKEHIREKELKYHKKNKDKLLSYDKAYCKKNRKKILKRRWKNTPQQMQTRKTLGYAVSSGKIFKPNKCKKCGKKFPKKKIHGHHFNYSKPLEVFWLCQKCHYSLHQYLEIIKEAKSEVTI